MSNTLPTITVGITREPGAHLPKGVAGGDVWLGIHLGCDTALKDLEELLVKVWRFAIYELAGTTLTLVHDLTVEEPFRDSPFDRSSPDASASAATERMPRPLRIVSLPRLVTISGRSRSHNRSSVGRSI